MRKGARRNDWSTKDLRYLRDNAGLVPVSKIAKHLNRTPKAIKRKAESMGISTRYYNSSLVWCSSCAHLRTAVNPYTGKCRVCSKREQLQKSEWRVSDALSSLPCNLRHEYNLQETKRLSGTPPKPVRKKVSSDPRYRFRYMRELYRYAREIELWEIKCLDRRINANKKRLERIRNKLGTNPRKKFK